MYHDTNTNHSDTHSPRSCYDNRNNTTHTNKCTRIQTTARSPHTHLGTQHTQGLKVMVRCLHISAHSTICVRNHKVQFSVEIS